MPEHRVWFNGRMVEAREAVIPVGSAAARYGINAFEGICAYVTPSGLGVFRLRDHAERLLRSASMLGLLHSYSLADVEDAVLACLSENGVAVDSQIRLTMFVTGEGNAATCAPVSLVCSTFKRAPRSLDARAVSATISPWMRIDDRVMPPRVKAGANYLNGRYALLDAQAAGYDEAILLTRHGRVAEAASACLFMVRNGCLLTPRVTDSILESITRETVITIAKAAGVGVEVRGIDPSELRVADEIFLCGSGYEITPVRNLDGLQVGSGPPGPVTSAMWNAYEKAVRRPDPERGWVSLLPLRREPQAALA